MQVWTKLGPDEIDHTLDVYPAVTDAHELRNGTWRYRMQLKLAGSTPRDQSLTARYQRRGYPGPGRNPLRLPRINAVCWHGYRDWMRQLFALDPDARIKTSHADYRGNGDFERQFEATGDHNIGSMMAPMAYRNACDCVETTDAAEREITGRTH